MKKKSVLFNFAIMLFLFTACGFVQNDESSVTQGILENESGAEGTFSKTDQSAENAALPEYVYNTEVMRYSELLDEFSFRKDVEVTRTDYAAYYFETSIDAAERSACIAATDKVLSCVDAVRPEIEIVVLSPESYDGILVSGNRLYTPVQPWESAGYIAKVLLAGYGEWSNYGMAYGYADYLCGKAGMGGAEPDTNDREAVSGDREPASDGRETVSDERDRCEFQPMNSMAGYDLSLLCFDENFASAEDVEAAKNNACLFAEWYMSSHSEEEYLELLSASGTSEGAARANEALESFYEEHGVECSLTKILYEYGGMSLDYAAACEYAVFYIGKDWQDQIWEMNPMVPENFLHEDYSAIKEFFECNVRQMKQYQELFDLDSYSNELTVFFPNNAELLQTSFYQVKRGTIYLDSVVSLMHEYIHFLMDGYDDPENKWTVEGFARYYDCLYNDYGCAFWNQDYNDPEGAFQAYIEYIGRPVDSRADNRYLNDFLVRAYEWSDPNLTYESGASFVAYLVECYGLEDVIQYIGSDIQFNAKWGKSYKELVQDWNDYIEQNYSWYAGDYQK